MPRALVDLINAANVGRDPERLAMKYARLRADAFAFLRGTAALFYVRAPQAKSLHDAPTAWACGDAHLENFGCYKGDNRLVYFDVNDFDEAAIAPCPVDILRLAASIRVAGRAQGAPPRRAARNAETAMAAWLEAVASGKAQWVERDTATGPVRERLDRARSRTRQSFLDARTELGPRGRRIRLDGRRAAAALPVERKAVQALLAEVDHSGARPRGFYRVIDVARRIAGTGSLGLERFVVLVSGKGSPAGNYLLDLKAAVPSALAQRSRTRRPRAVDEAQRVVRAQRLMQAVPIAFLMPVRLGGRAFLLRDLQPAEDRLSVSQARDDPAVGDAFATMGRLLGWAQLRASGHARAAAADALIAYAARPKRLASLAALAEEWAERVESDWLDYCRAYDAGELDCGRAAVARR